MSTDSDKNIAFTVKRICAGCEYWQRNGRDGICRRHAPKPVVAQRNSVPWELVWPGTDGGDWCGDFKERQG